MGMREWCPVKLSKIRQYCYYYYHFTSICGSRLHDDKVGVVVGGDGRQRQVLVVAEVQQRHEGGVQREVLIEIRPNVVGQNLAQRGEGKAVAAALEAAAAGRLGRRLGRVVGGELRENERAISVSKRNAK